MILYHHTCVGYLDQISRDNKLPIPPTPGSKKVIDGHAVELDEIAEKQPAIPELAIQVTA